MVISKDDIEAFATTKEQKDFWRIDMKIEVGKTYQIDPLYKKSLVEIEQFRHEDGRMLNTEVLWRGGTFHIKITNQEEADELQGCIGEDGDMWDYESFEEIEMDSTFDGCSEDFIFYGNHFTEEEQEQMNEAYEAQMESDDWMSRYEWLEDQGFESLGCNWIIEGGLQVEESETEIFV
tara:strand:+ start:767 stop:1300 length:534 start_codon:yes stop_codon:yes gene_type:complete